MTDLHISPTPVNVVFKYAKEDAAPYIYVVLMERHLAETVAIDLDVTDSKGRALGHRVSILRQEHAYGNGTAQSNTVIPAADAALWIGESFVVTASTLRNGQTFGASQSGKRVKTLEEALALREAIFAKARKTVSKRSGVKA